MRFSKERVAELEQEGRVIGDNLSRKEEGFIELESKYESMVGDYHGRIEELERRNLEYHQRVNELDGVRF